LKSYVSSFFHDRLSGHISVIWNPYWFLGRVSMSRLPANVTAGQVDLC